MAPGPLGVGIVVASLLASFGALYLLQYLYRERGNPGADWFMGNIASVAVFCLSYGIALLVFETGLRVALESVAFVCVCFMGPFFLAFGLDYTGRGDLIRTPLFAIVWLVPLLSVVLVATNPIYHLVWTDFGFESVFGLATATYTIQPWGVFAFAFSIGTAAVGSLLLIGAILSYGPLYRREATAVILSTVPPSLGVALWTFGVGPVPELHLTAPFMLVHVTLDAYAFVGTHMFETSPATQRMAERTGLDSLSDPVFVLDPERQVVRLNDRGTELFVSEQSPSLPVPLDSILGVTMETLRERGEITVDAAGGRTFAMSHTELTDQGGDTVGSMLVLYDVTEQRQRGQRLAVLNRVLRHNLRNETGVIRGYAEELEASVDDPEQAAQAGTIMAASNRLNAIAEKVKSFEAVQQRAVQSESLAVDRLLAEIERGNGATQDEATITWTVDPPDIRVHTDRAVLSEVLENLVENAIVHSDATEPTVRITVSEVPDSDASVRFEVRDDNDPIPTQEVETLRAGEETALQHGQGVGLWISYWCANKLRGDIDFEYDDGNVVTVTL